MMEMEGKTVAKDNLVLATADLASLAYPTLDFQVPDQLVDALLGPCPSGAQIVDPLLAQSPSGAPLASCCCLI